MISYCITLPERPQKWINAQREFKKLHGNVMKWNATKKVIGFDGCRESHLGLLQHLAFDFPNELYTVYEDDVQFCVNFPQMAINEAIQELPLDWDILYLGATLQQPLNKHSEHLFKLKGAYTTHAMIFNNQNGVVDFILENNGGGRKIDVFYADVIQERFNCFITAPMIATQRDGFSDIMNRECKNSILIQDYYNRYTK